LITAHTRERGGAADEVEVVADGVGTDMGDDGTGHGRFGSKVVRRAHDGAARVGMVAWRRAKPVSIAILFMLDQF
jgi:hypothetical protein